MKLHYYLLLFTIHLSLFSTPSVSGQANKPCNNFDCAYKKAENFLKQAAYPKALDNLDSAEVYLTDTNTEEKEQIKGLRRRLFVAIEKEKEGAKRARDEAKRQTEIAKNALVQVEIEKLKADSSYKISENQRQIAEQQKIIAQKQTDSTKIALQKADSLYSVAVLQRKEADLLLWKQKSLVSMIDSQNRTLEETMSRVYFYKNKLGLSYDNKNQKYGFIDRNSKTIIEFKYDKASMFDSTGFAKVKKKNTEYLIDTLGIEYKLGKSYRSPSKDITALDLTNNKEHFAIDKIFNNPQLRVLLLSNTGIEDSDISHGIEFIKGLIYLDLSSNELTNVPKQIENITSLKRLNLKNNRIDKDNQEKIKKLLPNCEIQF